MKLKKIPIEISDFLIDAGIIIHFPLIVEKITIENTFKKPKIFNSHLFSDYQNIYFQYRVTAPSIVGEIIIEEFNGRLSLIRNSLSQGEDVDFTLQEN